MPTATPALEPASRSDHRAAARPRRAVRLLLVDDHSAVRLGLEQLLESQPDFMVEAVCVNAEGAVAQASTEPIDVAVVDYHLGGRNGLWACRQLKRLPEPPRVIVYSAFANDHLAACCAVAGADAVLNKGGLGSELCDAIRSVMHGRRLLPRVSQPLADLLRRRLNDAEQPLFGMLMAGIPREEIERTLDMSARERDSREAAMLRKLEALPGEGQERGGRTGLHAHPAVLDTQEVARAQSYLRLERC
jgi:DNA-binding NarL/FixJ family response regulator